MSVIQSVKKFFKKAGSVYKDVSSRSGGCGYIPPNCLSTPQKKANAPKAPDQTEKED